MGIRGLHSLCSSQANELADAVNITIMSRERVTKGERRPIIIIDGMFLIFHIFQKLDVTWHWLLGGEYKMFAAELEKFIKDMQTCEVDIVVVLDPARGSEGLQKKKSEHEKRFADRSENMDKIISCIQKNEDPESLDEVEWSLEE
ncbi:hypothetical protein GUITHDRAFT_121306 [Guillardia theta CCMP2712]|uniref:XPG N-terminal domain-containing protein n=1 Tax=Guillardia theta (strain CCMP2712) TaxID=905079 RepID=L1I9D5_GUITC|nr:hypothetical protein GUITHDRAFT_121306 [Guillardia theta CCMP2712]EKX32519.1 hypothetical protein GUITHDRAFT_121306 [Guillardia theta CCMP2712]|eukprot:XP_005819499.1 hypothetical protein GUITHDRAFT_121306 [Guillardia theta CCMP2712]